MNDRPAREATADPPLRAAGRLALAALVAASIVTAAWALTRERIAGHERDARRQALALVLPAERYDNDPDAEAVRVQAPAWLGHDDARVRRARRGSADAALVLDVVAPDGYAGPIALLVAVDRDGRVLGVRVTRHDETPGLTDGLARGGWIDAFRGRALGDPSVDRWRLKRDGGDFDQFAGATTTPRAVVEAVARTLAFVATHGDAVRAAPAGTRLRFDDVPPAAGVPR